MKNVCVKQVGEMQRNLIRFLRCSVCWANATYMLTHIYTCEWMTCRYVHMCSQTTWCGMAWRAQQASRDKCLATCLINWILCSAMARMHFCHARRHSLCMYIYVVHVYILAMLSGWKPFWAMPITTAHSLYINIYIFMYMNDAMACE